MDESKIAYVGEGAENQDGGEPDILTSIREIKNAIANDAVEPENVELLREISHALDRYFEEHGKPGSDENDTMAGLTVPVTIYTYPVEPRETAKAFVARLQDKSPAAVSRALCSMLPGPVSVRIVPGVKCIRHKHGNSYVRHLSDGFTVEVPGELAELGAYGTPNDDPVQVVRENIARDVIGALGVEIYLGSHAWTKDPNRKYFHAEEDPEVSDGVVSVLEAYRMWEWLFETTVADAFGGRYADACLPEWLPAGVQVATAA